MCVCVCVCVCAALCACLSATRPRVSVPMFDSGCRHASPLPARAVLAVSGDSEVAPIRADMGPRPPDLTRRVSPSQAPTRRFRLTGGPENLARAPRQSGGRDGYAVGLYTHN